MGWEHAGIIRGAFKTCFLHVESEMGNGIQVNMLNWICEPRARREIRDINLGVTDDIQIYGRAPWNPLEILEEKKKGPVPGLVTPVFKGPV